MRKSPVLFSDKLKMWTFVALCLMSIPVIIGDYARFPWPLIGDPTNSNAANTTCRPFWSLVREGWRCTSGRQQCIHSGFLCDGNNDCGGGEDEGEVCGGYGEDRTCTNPVTKQAVGWRDTSGRQQCIPSRVLCDGYNDYEGEDEVCGGHGEDRTCISPLTGEVKWRCTSGRQQCIPSQRLCDGYNDCEGGEDEVCGGHGEDRTCISPLTGEVKWRCTSGRQQCINRWSLCDGYKDCEGAEDEGELCGGHGEDRTCTNPLTGEVRWRCTSGSQQCIDSLWLCNGRNNCEGGEDEGEVCGGRGVNRTCTNPLTGEADRWRCTSGRQQCIPSNWLCDGSNDCEGGEDEGEVCGGRGV